MASEEDDIRRRVSQMGPNSEEVRRERERTRKDEIRRLRELEKTFQKIAHSIKETRGRYRSGRHESDDWPSLWVSMKSWSAHDPNEADSWSVLISVKARNPRLDEDVAIEAFKASLASWLNNTYPGVAAAERRHFWKVVVRVLIGLTVIAVALGLALAERRGFID